FFFSSRRRHTRCLSDWSSDVCSSDLLDALGTQVYQAILERRPAPVIPRLKEILAKPDPVLGYSNGELRFFLGWAQEVAGDHAARSEERRVGKEGRYECASVT